MSAGGKLRDLNPEESWAILEDLALYDNESWNNPRDFAKPVKAIALPQDVPSASDRHLIELKNQVQRLMEAHLAPTQLAQVNKITTLCEVCNGPHDTQYCMENPEQAFVEYASSRTNEAGEGLVFEFMASQDARLSKFEADFKQQQKEMTNKIDTVLKAITNWIAGALPSDTLKNPKLGTHPVLTTRSYPTMDPQCSTQIHGLINTITIHPKQPKEPHTEDDGERMFIEIIRDNEPQCNDPHKVEGATTEEPVVEYFDTFLTRDELTYHRMPHNLKIPYNIGHVHIEKAYIDLNSPLNIMTQTMYNWIMRRKLNPREDANGGISNFTGRIKGMHVFVGNFTYDIVFMIVEDISSILDPRLSQVVLGKPFIEISMPRMENRINIKFLGAIPINLKCNMWESEELIKKLINRDKPPKNGDGAWHAMIRLIDPDGEEFTKTLQSIPTTRKISEIESPREIIDF
ncbi:hypothetical protein Tco_0681075 [Tanacetum coccineum]|uniref:MAK10-like protein n=1 Tax=Tanacetum coccineum TaxID=301880 RepID=A0ABQ4XNS8_9ASTR